MQWYGQKRKRARRVSFPAMRKSAAKTDLFFLDAENAVPSMRRSRRHATCKHRRIMNLRAWQSSHMSRPS